MKNSMFLFALALVASASARADSYPVRVAFTETHPLDVRGEITLENANGAIEIRTWDRAEVKIEGEKRAATDEELQLIGLSIDARPDRLAIKTDFPKRKNGWFSGGQTIRAEVRFTLTVPATVALRKIDAVNGTVSVEGVRGHVSLHSVNGRITATGLASDGEFSTVNGSVHAEFAAMAAVQKISAETVNGSVSIALPPDASFHVRASTVNGRVSCDFPLQLEGGRARSHLKGTAGSGATAIKLEAVNGSLEIKKR